MTRPAEHRAGRSRAGARAVHPVRRGDQGRGAGRRPDVGGPARSPDAREPGWLPGRTRARSAGTGLSCVQCGDGGQAASESSSVRFRVRFWSTRMPGPFVVENVAFAM